MPPSFDGFLLSPLQLPGLQSASPVPGLSSGIGVLAARLGFDQLPRLADLGQSSSWTLGSTPSGCAA